MGLALGAAIVIGLIALASAAGSVLVLFFLAVLLASALEPIIGLLRDRLHLGRGATILVVYVVFFLVVVHHGGGTIRGGYRVVRGTSSGRGDAWPDLGRQRAACRDGIRIRAATRRTGRGPAPGLIEADRP